MTALSRGTGEAMQQFMITWEANLTEGGSAVDCLDDVMAHLIADDDVFDPSIEYNADDLIVAFEFALNAADGLDAIAKAATLIRTALHAGLVCTPGWPDTEQLANAFKFAHGPSVDALTPA